jgi:hypothetical protein
MVTWSCHLRVASGSWQLDLTNIFQDNKTVLPYNFAGLVGVVATLDNQGIEAVPRCVCDV